MGTEPNFLDSPSDLPDFDPAIRGSSADPTAVPSGLVEFPDQQLPQNTRVSQGPPGSSGRQSDPEQLGSPGGVGADIKGHVQARCGWGEYQSYIRDALESCADYVGRLQRSLEGETAPDRHYFVEKASALKEWATILLARCEETERWIEGGTP